jgi:DNA-directed RNA polymerase sigma subunit (sigma70/sigma32)
LSDLKTEKNEPDIHLTQLNLALQELSDIEKHVILTYFDYYDWQNPRKHLPDRVLKELRDTYSTTSDNLKHIKFRAMKKLRKILEK